MLLSALRLRTRLISFLLVILVAGFWRTLTYLSDPVIDLLLYIAGGVLTAFVASFGGHVATQNRLHRWIFYVSGFALCIVIIASGVRNYHSAIRSMTPQEIVKEANDHTDTEVAMVRDDLKQAQKHNDEQVGNLHRDVQSIGEALAKTGTDLGNSISKVGKPEPPEKPRFLFSLWGADGSFDAAQHPLLNYAIRPDKDGVFAIDYTFVNTSSVAASKTDLWVHICKACEFAAEPDGFAKPEGIEAGTRTRSFPGTINAGTAFSKSTLRIRLKEQLSSFDIGFHYSCETCGGMSKIQTLTITVLP